MERYTITLVLKSSCLRRTGTVSRARQFDHSDRTCASARQRPRLDLSCLLFFFGEDEFEGEASLLNISTYGCRVKSAVSLRVGMTLKLSLFLTDHQWPLRIDEATVLWADGHRYGLEFTQIRPAQRERLRALFMKAESRYLSNEEISLSVSM